MPPILLSRYIATGCSTIINSIFPTAAPLNRFSTRRFQLMISSELNNFEIIKAVLCHCDKPEYANNNKYQIETSTINSHSASLEDDSVKF